MKRLPETKRALARAINTALGAFGIELRRRITAGPRRTTLEAALWRLKRQGFSPRTVIDVGVAEGTEALYRTFTEARHILVEPLAEFASHLERIQRRFAHVECVAAAAGSKPGRVTLNIGPHLQLSSRHQVLAPQFSATDSRAVDVVTLDDIWSSRNAEAPALLKIDVEGDELEVLRGAPQVLTHCEYLVLEVPIRETFRGAPRVEEVVDYLARCDFALNDFLDPAYDSNGNLQMVDLAFVPRRGQISRLERSS
jgi:FkbM family methyltransferase